MRTFLSRASSCHLRKMEITPPGDKACCIDTGTAQLPPEVLNPGEKCGSWPWASALQPAAYPDGAEPGRTWGTNLLGVHVGGLATDPMGTSRATDPGPLPRCGLEAKGYRK